MSSAPITSVFNDGYIAESLRGVPSRSGVGRRVVAPVLPLRRAARRSRPDIDHRRRGPGLSSQGRRRCSARRCDPHSTVTSRCSSIRSGRRRSGAAELTPEFHGITEADLQLVPALALGFDVGTGDGRRRRDFASSTRRRWASSSRTSARKSEREWFRETIEHERLARYLTPEEKRAVLTALSEVDGLERFIGTRVGEHEAVLHRGDRRARADARRRSSRSRRTRARAKS